MNRILDYRKTMIGQLPASYKTTSEDERFLALALCGEVGELTELTLILCREAGKLGNLVKKRWRDGPQAECPNCHDANSCGDYEGPACGVCEGKGYIDHVEAIRDEIADVRIYLEMLARLFDVDGEKMEDRAIDKFRRVVEQRGVST